MKRPVSVAPASFAALALLIAVPAFLPIASAQAAAHLGKWVLNVNRSVYTPGPPPRAQVRTYSMEGDHFKAVIETTQPLGMKTRTEYMARFDGKDYPVTGNVDVDTVALTRVDDLTFDAVLKRRGKVTSTVRNTVSKNGITMTVTSKGTNARGQPTSSVAVFVKQ